MMSRDWQRSRSDFNHGWLKNRLLVGLLKCVRVASGQVEDQQTWQARSVLIREWREMRKIATSLLEAIEERIAAPATPQPGDSEALGVQPCYYMLEVERQLWLARNSSANRLAEARRHLAALDRKLSELDALTSTNLQAPEACLLNECVNAARGLGEQFSKLTVPRDCILC